MIKEVRYEATCPNCGKKSTYVYTGPDEKFDPNYKVSCLTCRSLLKKAQASEVIKDDQYKTVQITEKKLSVAIAR